MHLANAPRPLVFCCDELNNIHLYYVINFHKLCYEIYLFGHFILGVFCVVHKRETKNFFIAFNESHVNIGPNLLLCIRNEFLKPRHCSLFNL